MTEWSKDDLELISRAKSAFERGNALYGSGHPLPALSAYNESLRHLQSLLDLHPGSDDVQAAVATIWNNRGTALGELGRPEEALGSFDEAWELYRTVECCPDDENYQTAGAAILTNQGNALSDLGRPEEALRSHDAALKLDRSLFAARHLEAENFQANLATTLNNRGAALSALGRLEEALECHDEARVFRQSLLGLHPENKKLQADLAMSLSNCGAALSDLSRPEEAFRSHDAALKLRRSLLDLRPEDENFQAAVAATQNNRGYVLNTLGRTEEALASLDDARKILAKLTKGRPGYLVPQRLVTWMNLGSFDPTRGLELFREAVALADGFRGSFRDPRNREFSLQRTQHLYELLVEACVGEFRRTSDPGEKVALLAEALETAEKSRARRFFELLHDEDLDEEALVEAADDDQKSRVRELFRDFLLARKEFQAAIHQENAPLDRDGSGPTLDLGGGGRSFTAGRQVAAPPPDPEVQNQRRRDLDRRIKDLQSKHDRLKAEIQAAVPEFGFDPDRPVPALPFADLLKQVPTDLPTAVVHYSSSDRGGVALILFDGQLDAVELPDLNAKRATEMAQSWYDAYPVGATDQSAFEKWANQMPGLLQPVAEAAVHPLLEKLGGRGIRRLLLVPNRYLYPFPLHACCLPDGETFLADAFDPEHGLEITYAPSLSILAHCRKRPRSDQRLMVAAENPTNDFNLRFPSIEIARIGSHFGGALRKKAGRQVTRDWIKEELRDASFWHYSGHSFFHAEDPLASALVLESKKAEDRWLTLRDLFTRSVGLPRNRLSVLSGCESGMVRVDRIGEYVGLSSGFLFAGAQCVLASLWRVDDLSTTLLMDRVYSLWREEGLSIGTALHRAQRWLRASTGTELAARVLNDSFLNAIPKELRFRVKKAAEDLLKKDGDSHRYAVPAHWAAFIAVGLASLSDREFPPEPQDDAGAPCPSC